MRFERVQKNHWWREYTELVGLYFLHAMAMGMWFVPLASVLDAHGLSSLKPVMYATSGISAIISPLIFGALADRRYSPVTILRALTFASSVTVALAATAIHCGWSRFTILAFVQLYSLCTSPTFGISTTIILARLDDAKREFGPIRAMATFGWMVGCWIISYLGFDGSAGAGYSAAVVWLLVSAFTFVLPVVPPPASSQHLTWHQRLGLDALSLLKNKDTRTVFIGAALYNIPMSAFYPFTPTHLGQLGMPHPSAWMTLGQVTEMAAMFALAGLLTHWRLKWIFLTGMSWGIARYVACALDGKGWVLAGITMHGFAFSLYFITAQIYLEQRISHEWRARAQALLTLMITGIGSTVGYMACGAWNRAQTHDGHTQWPLFWGGLAGSVAVIWLWFFWSYHGRPGTKPGGAPDLAEAAKTEVH
jgi:nucleoside transporter